MLILPSDREVLEAQPCEMPTPMPDTQEKRHPQKFCLENACLVCGFIEPRSLLAQPHVRWPDTQAPTSFSALHAAPRLQAKKPSSVVKQSQELYSSNTQTFTDTKKGQMRSVTSAHQQERVLEVTHTIHLWI